MSMEKAVSLMWLWKLALARLIIHNLIVVGTGYLGAMGNQTWTSLDGDSRFKLITGLGIASLTTTAAFLDKTSAKLSAGGVTPPDTGDTQIISKTP